MQEVGRIGRLDVYNGETGGVGAYLKFFEVVAARVVPHGARRVSKPEGSGRRAGL